VQAVRRANAFPSADGGADSFPGADKVKEGADKIQQMGQNLPQPPKVPVPGRH
jgi:hypothetical protein